MLYQLSYPPTTQTLVTRITSVNNLLQLFFENPEPVAFQRSFTRTIDDLAPLRQPGVLLRPFAAADLIRVLRVGVVPVPVRTVLHRTVVPEKQDAFRSELEGQFNRAQPTIVLAVGFVPVQIVFRYSLARAAPALRP